jgi:hypothetical protein
LTVVALPLIVAGQGRRYQDESLDNRPYDGQFVFTRIRYGARGGFFNGSSWTLGSVADKVIRCAPCPVLTVRHPEHEFVLPDALQLVARTKA